MRHQRQGESSVLGVSGVRLQNPQELLARQKNPGVQEGKHRLKMVLSSSTSFLTEVGFRWLASVSSVAAGEALFFVRL